MKRALQDALRIVLRDFLARIAWCRRFHRFLDIHQGDVPLLALADAEQRGVAKQAKRAASLHPVGGIQHFHERIIVARAQRRGEMTQPWCGKEFFDRITFGFGKRPELCPERYRRLLILQTFLGQCFPRSSKRLLHHEADGVRRVVQRVRVVLQGGLIALDHLLEDASRRDTGKVRATRCRRKRQSKPNKIVDRITDYSLIKIPDLYGNPPIDARNRAQIPRMTVATYPDGRPLRKGVRSSASPTS